MTRTYLNDDGVLVVDAGPVVLESRADLGPAANADTTPQGEVSTDVDGDAAGE